MIFCLWIMYGVGFSIVGVNNGLFFAILCGTLEIIPFVGNITGTTLTVLMVQAQRGRSGMVVSVLITYGLVQFLQSYILQLFFVGKDVDVNPLLAYGMGFRGISLGHWRHGACCPAVRNGKNSLLSY